ncbi:uncharacterized protein LOC129125630 [Agelaius phoeniceus]|uniref:uncharacterized protein LOC129125630 n=1 Tax=Agelaius phoeniceus TaxID=39638 RepID=UPI0040550629
MKPLPFLFKGVTRVAFFNGRGVVAYPVTMASALECGQRVQPQETGILRKRLTKKHQEDVEQQCQQELPSCRGRLLLYMTQTCIPRCPRDFGWIKSVSERPIPGSKSGYQQSRQSTSSAIQVAFGNGPGVAAPPVMMASVSERARSVRPEQLSVLRTMLSQRHQPGASSTFPADEVAFLCT